MPRRRRDAVLEGQTLRDRARALDTGGGIPDLPGWEAILNTDSVALDRGDGWSTTAASGVGTGQTALSPSPDGAGQPVFQGRGEHVLVDGMALAVQHAVLGGGQGRHKGSGRTLR